MKTFPKDFTFRMKDPTTKAAFVSEIESPNPDLCQNCGGAGKMYIFIATGGPFKDVPGFGKVGHWHKDRWWVGKTFGGICPICNGFGKIDTGEPKADPERAQKLIDDFTPRLPYADD